MAQHRSQDSTRCLDFSSTFSQTKLPFDIDSMSEVPTNQARPPTTEDGEEDVEVEYVDDEVEYESETDGVESAQTRSTVETPPAKSPSPKKVRPSSEVRNLEMRSPESTKADKRKLPLDKNPFPIKGDWTKDTFSQIQVRFPHLTGKNETTNELTRSNNPETRYWRAPITFSAGQYTSETLRFDNVLIPYHTGKGYGSGYAYVRLPAFAGEAFREAGRSIAPTKTQENSLEDDSNCWWKIANNLEGKFGVINNSTRKFHAKSLETIFDGSQSGISCSLVLKFNCKASTLEKEQLRPTTVRTVAVEVVRGYVCDLDVNVQMPTRIRQAAKAAAEPVAIKKDVATDSLMQRLSELGM